MVLHQVRESPAVLLPGVKCDAGGGGGNCPEGDTWEEPSITCYDGDVQ